MKKLLIGFVLVFMTISVLDYLIHGVVLERMYEQNRDVFRPDMEGKMWIFSLVTAVVSFFFVLIFSKGYEGTGVREGVRYGCYAGMMLATTMAYGSYASYPIPYGMAISWFVYGLVEYIIAGVVCALVYGSNEAPATS